MLPETQPCADKVWAIMGFSDLKALSAGWCGLPYWLDAGIRGGWKPDLILTEVRTVAERLAKAGNPTPPSFRYLEHAINEPTSR